MTRTSLFAMSLTALWLSSCLASAQTAPEMDRVVTYSSYSEMARTEKSGIDFKVVHRSGSRSFLIAAPHGGNIEPGSTELADAIAGDNFGFYTLNGLKRDSSDLIVPSCRYDEPELTRVTRNYNTIIAIHVIPSTEKIIFVGGGYQQMCDWVSYALTQAGYTVQRAPKEAAANNRKNFINKDAIGGVQIEVSSALVDEMFRGPVSSERIRQDTSRRTPAFNRFVGTITQVLARVAPKSGGVKVRKSPGK